MVESKLLFAVFVKLKSNYSELLVKVPISHMVRFKFRVFQTIAKGLEANDFLPYVYSSWKRGANKNTNHLIRLHSTENTDFISVENGQFRLAKWSQIYYISTFPSSSLKMVAHLLST
ncbi:hypothetical protein ACJJI3_10725 [Microbulbifer sp. ZKSA004]|uniref:hypothetical protein n=1 Tax=Microbulbifer sp. ZKSA004 TaxID=3243389 RepID=UPI00403A2676